MYHIYHKESGKVLYNKYGEYQFNDKRFDCKYGLIVEFYTIHDAYEFIAHYPKIENHVEVIREEVEIKI